METGRVDREADQAAARFSDCAVPLRWDSQDEKALGDIWFAEMAELAKFYFDNDSCHQVVAFTVDDAFIDGDQFQCLPLVPFSEVTRRYPPDAFDMYVALSYSKMNRLRQDKYEQAKAAGYELVSYVCRKSVTWPDLRSATIALSSKTRRFSLGYG